MKHEPTAIYVPIPIFDVLKTLSRNCKKGDKFSIHCEDLIETIMHKHCRFQDMTIPEDVDRIDIALQTGEILFVREPPKTENQNT